ncbi:hypothetical protein ACFX2C_004281 [Malus domestica]
MNENFLVHFFALCMKDGIMSLAKVEEAYRHERVTKETIEEAIQSYSLYHLQDALDAADENRLLPAVNKIWPFLLVCIRNKNPVAVRRCLCVVSNECKFVEEISFHDAPH